MRYDIPIDKQLCLSRSLETDMNILNLTQHIATSEQVAAGVVEPADKAAIQALITFDDLPTAEQVRAAANAVAELAAQSGAPAAMIGGAPFFMGPLEAALRNRDITPLYAFSKREAADVPQPDGSVKKTQVFRHVGFVYGGGASYLLNHVILTNNSRDRV